MSKPDTLQDLITNGVAGNRDVEDIARLLFDGARIFTGPNGHQTVIVAYDRLPDACKQFIRKAISMSSVQNILDVNEEEDDEKDVLCSSDPSRIIIKSPGPVSRP